MNSTTAVKPALAVLLLICSSALAEAPSPPKPTLWDVLRSRPEFTTCKDAYDFVKPIAGLDLINLGQLKKFIGANPGLKKTKYVELGDGGNLNADSVTKLNSIIKARNKELTDMKTKLEGLVEPSKCTDAALKGAKDGLMGLANGLGPMLGDLAKALGPAGIGAACLALTVAAPLCAVLAALLPQLLPELFSTDENVEKRDPFPLFNRARTGVAPPAAGVEDDVTALLKALSAQPYTDDAAFCSTFITHVKTCVSNQGTPEKRAILCLAGSGTKKDQTNGTPTALRHCASAASNPESLTGCLKQVVKQCTP